MFLFLGSHNKFLFVLFFLMCARHKGQHARNRGCREWHKTQRHKKWKLQHFSINSLFSLRHSFGGRALTTQRMHSTGISGGGERNKIELQERFRTQGMEEAKERGNNNRSLTAHAKGSRQQQQGEEDTPYKKKDNFGPIETWDRTKFYNQNIYYLFCFAWYLLQV